MNFQEALNYLKEVDDKAGIKPGLERIRELLARLGDPQDHLRTVHVAGTNGKGSVCSYIAAGLEEAGFKTGIYTSPAVFSWCEKVRVCGEWIRRDEAAALITEISCAAEAMEDKPSSFEIETAMAFLYFCRKGCSFAVIETGMGGLLDATNVIKAPAVSVITNVAMDHTAYLGNTLAEIAANKGGIIKENCPCVFFRESGDAYRGLMEIAESKGSEPFPADMGLVSNIRTDAESGQFFDYNGHNDYHIRMLGAAQVRNAVLAIEALRVIGRSCPEVDETAIRGGLSAALLHGRFDILSREPVVICDGAHNPAAARDLSETLAKLFPGRRIILVMGIFADKDHREVLRIMSGVSGIVITFTPENKRGLDAYSLAVEAGDYFPQVIVAKSHRDAVSKAVNICGRNDVIVQCGSLSTIPEFEEFILRMGLSDENRLQEI
ncbi:MAG: bifunctional folylpolyglutamate synthase/dihydrofolate synthase [Lachnospiraceae bacterium]|nr:bifunctional folylpolyglutamate synthase/dihydrofolate synthase [Lachnospiraceae bacterium]